jgi:hypothetical protein
LVAVLAQPKEALLFRVVVLLAALVVVLRDWV